MKEKTLTGILLDERAELSLKELSRACSGSAEWVVELVEEGLLEPIGHQHVHWRFSGTSLLRARAAMRLQDDLKINVAGAALALDLMEEIATLRERLRRFETNDGT
jgi:chaperone modulatory protein CbpM